MSFILYHGIEDKTVQMLNQFFIDRRQNTGQMGSVTHVKDEKGLNEALIAMAFDCLFFEQKHIPDSPIEWLKKFRNTRPNIKGKMILLGDEPDRLQVLSYLEAGWTDYIYTPPDRPLLVEKVSLFTTGKRSSERQVYSMSLNEPADVAKPGTIVEMSEFDCHVKSLYPAKLDEVMIIYTNALGENNQKAGSAIARCYQSNPHPNAIGFFLNSYNFVGVTPDVLQNIRNSLRKTYVAGKGPKK